MENSRPIVGLGNTLYSAIDDLENKLARNPRLSEVGANGLADKPRRRSSIFRIEKLAVISSIFVFVAISVSPLILNRLMKIGSERRKASF
jgi:hypothetical protein